jgi:hypothetical protein
MTQEGPLPDVASSYSLVCFMRSHGLPKRSVVPPTARFERPVVRQREFLNNPFMHASSWSFVVSACRGESRESKVDRNGERPAVRRTGPGDPALLD